MIDIFSHFQQSAKRKSQLREFMEFNNNEIRKVIKHVCTRWLSLGKCIERTLKQWESLESYFLSYFDLQVDPTEEVLDDQPNRAKRLVKTFKDPVTKLYAMFVQLVIPIFDSFNTFLQSEEPLTHVLYESTTRLYCSLLSRFIIPEVISSTDDILSIDIEDPINLKDNKDLFLGIMTKQCAWRCDLIGTTKYNKFLKEVRLIYMKCASYLKLSISILKDTVIKSLTFLRLPERYKASSDRLQVLMEKFRKVVLDVNALESKLLECQAASDSESPSYFDENGKPVRINLIWHQMWQFTESHSNQHQFKNLSQLAKFLLLIPHSNSYCESVFSTIRKICTEYRYNFGKNTQQGHASTSVYKETTSIRNNLLGVLIPKINIFCKKKM